MAVTVLCSSGLVPSSQFVDDHLPERKHFGVSRPLPHEVHEP
ncbi:hypothetical protein [Acidiferrimicrobium sp. IK]|nr:hypothetical protein [Acidiferrimicrobium sp. IK]